MTRRQRVAQSAAMIAIFTLISKGLGFIREVFIASRYGSGLEIGDILKRQNYKGYP